MEKVGDLEIYKLLSDQTRLDIIKISWYSLETRLITALNQPRCLIS